MGWTYEDIMDSKRTVFSVALLKKRPTEVRIDERE